MRGYFFLLCEKNGRQPLTLHPSTCDRFQGKKSEIADREKIAQSWKEKEAPGRGTKKILGGTENEKSLEIGQKTKILRTKFAKRWNERGQSASKSSLQVKLHRETKEKMK